MRPTKPKGRPLCLTCGKELAPRFDVERDPNILVTPRGAGEFWSVTHRPSALRSYGDHGGFFHSGPCAEAYAVAVATRLKGPPLDRVPPATIERDLELARRRHELDVVRVRRKIRENALADEARRQGLEERAP